MSSNVDTDPNHRPPQTDDLGAPLSGRARSLANLRPPWKPGESGNPRGLTREGEQVQKAAIRGQLESQLAKPHKKRKVSWAQALVEQWIEDAVDGSDAVRATAREQILKRLDPLEQVAGGGQVVVQGVRLELSPGTSVDSVTLMASSSGQASIAVEGTSESQVGPTAQVLDGSEGPRDVVLEDSKESRITGTGESGESA